MDITIPKKLEPIVKAFFADSPKTAKALIIQAAKAIYGINEDEEHFSFGSKKEIASEDLETVCSIMQGLQPKDMMEALYAAQIVASHMLGMKKLASVVTEDVRIGLKMLQFSNHALSQLQRKRNGGMQNITVNYNYAGTAPKSKCISVEEVVYAD